MYPVTRMLEECGIEKLKLMKKVTELNSIINSVKDGMIPADRGILLSDDALLKLKEFK